ncbi:hypothetical protein AYO20_09385 [Fonsecaea nubica]|uniref:HNH nuclease domain-containing protein n=1 Tax=Fonsecaea nubica TaxID=856822 RepID=A0A178CIX5_9EURO|nr:hypothetical protein AYO20_09385 [Fonsecaea nubica]OAL28661.1 hypothetical protein AYO20_09385 [Fonsecaea nubica]
MFDDGTDELIDGTNIDSPRNVITLTDDLHRLFEDFFRHPIFPVDRTLSLTETHAIDPPDPRLLALQSVITHILHVSAAGRHIEKILGDLDETDIKVDGSTESGYLTYLRLQSWWNWEIRAY